MDRELVTDGREDLAAGQLEAITGRDVGDREQEVPHACGDVLSDACHARLWRARHMTVGGYRVKPLASGRGARGVAIGSEQDRDGAPERCGVAAELATRGVEIRAAVRDPVRTPPADVDAVGRTRGDAVNPVALTTDPDRRMRPLH